MALCTFFLLLNAEQQRLNYLLIFLLYIVSYIDDINSFFKENVSVEKDL